MRTSTTVKTVLALGSLSGALWAGTFATFTDTQTATSTFTAGTVDLRLNGDATSAYAWTALSLSNMKPGDVLYKPLTVSNNGTLGYSYTMSSASTNDGKGLRDQLTFGIKVVADATTCDSLGVGYTASGTTATAAGALSAAAISARSLASGASEVLCAYVSLPSNTDNTFQGATTTTTFTFTATQS